MGRWKYSTRWTTDECKSISVFFLRRHNYFYGFRTGGISWSRTGTPAGNVGFTVSTLNGDEYIHFRYTFTDRQSGEATSFDYKVQLVSTHCHFGGLRWWFVCPLSIDGRQCGRRVAVLYLKGKYFGCRHCHKLVYESSRDHRSFYEPFARRTKLIEKRRAIFENKGRKGWSKRQFSKLLGLIQKSETLPKLPEPVIVRKTIVVKQDKGMKRQ